MRRTHLILLAALAAPCVGQQPQQQQKITVVLDAARGGTEYGARIDGHTYEKQVTLDLANRLRALLIARDFNVLLTRENDSLVTNEQRAAIANQNKPVACLLLHATAAGTGLHLWTSSLNPMPVGSTAVLWDEAQSPFVQRSQRLASELAAAFSRSKIAVSSGHTWIRPLDNMECPAVAIEVAPEDSDTPASDRTYQTRIAGALASQMLFWRTHTDVVDSILNPPPPPAPQKPVSADKSAASDAAARNRTTPTTSGTAESPATGSTTVTPAVPHPRRVSPTTPDAPDGTTPAKATTPRPVPVRPRPAASASEAQPQ